MCQVLQARDLGTWVKELRTCKDNSPLCAHFHYADQETARAATFLGPLLHKVTNGGGSWTPAEAPLPADAAASPFADLVSVACPSATSCVATGDYAVSSGGHQAVLVTGSGTSWAAAEAPLPANAAASPRADLVSVACPSATSCVATGYYTDSSGNTQARCW